MTLARRAVICAGVMGAGLARAEGAAELGGQTVELDTLLYVDVLDVDAETLRWTGEGQLVVTRPDGSELGAFDSGAVIPLSGDAGAFTLELTEAQSGDWDIEVQSPVASGGRLYSYDWRLDGGSFREDGAFDGSFYALVPAGGEDHTAVIELRADGLTGYEWHMFANGQGVDGVGAGRSVNCADPGCLDQSWAVAFPIYLGPPSIASYSALEPAASTLDFVADELDLCDQIALGETRGTFRFSSDVEGTYHLVCDINGDGTFDLSGPEDAALTGAAAVGENRVEWGGEDNAGELLPAGDYACQVTIAVGEFHYLGIDMETAYAGIQLYQVLATGAREPLSMFWNDEHVQSGAVEMESGEVGLASSGSGGLAPGDYDAPILANVNARSWGDFSSEGKGSTNLLDTFAFLASATSPELTISLVEPEQDSDGDGLTDYDESCVEGTDPGDPDSDGDGATDGEEIEQGYDPNDASDRPPSGGGDSGAHGGGSKGCASAPARAALGLGWLLALGAAARRRR